MEESNDPESELRFVWVGVPIKSANAAEDGDWVRIASEEIERISLALPSLPSPLDRPGRPDWVERLEAELTRSLFPAAFRGATKGLSPERFGYALGRQIGLFEWHLEYLSRWAHRLEGKVTITPEMEARGRDWLNALQVGAPKYRRAANRALLRAAGAVPRERASFFKGFSDGLLSAQGSGDLYPGTATTTATDIYEVMLLCWPRVVSLGSVRELHGLLIRVLGQNRVGPQKRVEKICERIGLTLRRPGRPCGGRNSDKGTP